MFYKTRIKNVTDYGAVDVNGRPLRFIGYLPVKAGDTVFTDGRFIFGNAPPKGAPAIFNEPSGVPVLGDFDSSGENELRGYFTMRGNYKKFNIAKDSWITNSKKNFAHGEETFDNEDVIDADITDSGDELIVTNGIYQNSRPVTSTFVYATVNDSRLFWYDRVSWERLHWLISLVYRKEFAVIEHILGAADFPAEQTPAKIFTNGQVSAELDLAPFAENVEQRALACAEQIMAQSYTDTTSDLTTFLVSDHYDTYATYSYSTPEIITSNENFRMPSTAGGVYSAPINTVDEPAHPPPDEPVIVYSAAHILTSNISDKGFDGIIFAAAYGYCFPRIRPRFSFLHGSIFDKIYEWKCIPFGFSALYRVTEGIADFEPIAARAFGGVDCDLPAIKGDMAFLHSFQGGIDTNNPITAAREYRHIELLPTFENADFSDNIFFPIGDGFYRMDKFGRLSFYDSMKNIIAENIPVHKDYYHVEMAHGEFLDDFSNPFFNNKPHLFHCKIYTSDGEVKDTTINLITLRNNIYSDAGDFPPMDGYYIKSPTGSLEPLQFTPLFYQFKNGSFLYGVKGGNLYLKTKGGIEQLIGDGSKNFRLRELKKISKAKK